MRPGGGIDSQSGGKSKKPDIFRIPRIIKQFNIQRSITMAMMNAVRIHEYGSLDVLKFEEAPCPQVAADEVLVRVFATSVNPFDWAVRNGYVTSYYSYPFPTSWDWTYRA